MKAQTFYRFNFKSIMWCLPIVLLFFSSQAKANPFGNDEVSCDESSNASIVAVEDDLSLRKEMVTSGTINIGNDVEFQITITNEGNRAIEDVTIVDSIPEGYIFNQAVNSGWTDIGDGKYSYTYSNDVQPNEDIQIPLNLTVDTDATAQNVVNFAWISGYTVNGSSESGDVDGAFTDIAAQSKLPYTKCSISEDADDHVDQAWVVLESESLSSEARINFSLTADCNDTKSNRLTVDMLLTSDLVYPKSAYIINIYDGNTLIANEFGKDQVGKTYKVEVSNCVTGVKAWVYVNVEYKFNPIIVCPDSTIVVNCGMTEEEIASIGLPTVQYDCIETEMIIINQYEVGLTDLEAEDYTKKVVRVWRAKSAIGMLSDDVCEQIIYTEKTSTGDIIWPKNFSMVKGNAFQCDEDPTINPKDHLDVTGVPRYNMVELDFLKERNFGGRHDFYGVAVGNLDNDSDCSNCADDVFFTMNHDTRNYFLNKVWYGAIDSNNNVVFTGSREEIPYLGDLQPYDVALGDLDGDGAIDAFVTTLTGRNVVLKGTGTATSNFTSLLDRVGPNGRTLAVSLGDIDGDGDLDAALANTTGFRNRVWLNDGTGNFGNPINIGGQSSLSRDIEFMDLNGDGDLDIFVANSNATFDVWMNNDGRGNYVRKNQTLNIRGIRGIDYGDVDDDGDIDVIIARRGTSAILYNNGDGDFTGREDLIGTVPNKDAALGDIDGDGDLDVIFAGGDGSVDSDTDNQLWLNDGHGNFVNSGIVIGKKNSREVKLADVNNDGKLDVIFANRDNVSEIYLNNSVLKYDIALYGNDTMSKICNVIVEFEDKVVLDENGVKKVRRTWTIYDWDNPDKTITHIQTIDIVDSEAPVINSLVQEVTASTDGKTCTANVVLPLPNVTDNCGYSHTSVASFTDMYYEKYNGEPINFTKDTHDVIYRVYDLAGNFTADTITVIVLDKTPPVALGLKNYVVGLSGGVACVKANILGSGSYDGCDGFNLDYKISKMDTTLNFKDEINLTCADATNGIVQVVIQVTDQSGNSSMVMVDVEIQDKSNRQLVGTLSNMNISCKEYEAAKVNLAQFGTLGVTDGCSGYELRDTVINDNVECGVGSFERKIELIMNGIVVDEVLQTITVENDGDIFSYDNISWSADKDTTILVDSFDVNNTKIIQTNGPEQINYDGCSLIPRGCKDEAYLINGMGKIIRTWTFLDWCQTNDNGDKGRRFTRTEVIHVTITGESLSIGLPADNQTLSVQGLIDCNAGVTITNDIFEATVIGGEAADSSFLVTKDGVTYHSGEGLNPTNFTYSPGTYVITYTVVDKYGRVETDSITFTVENVNPRADVSCSDTPTVATYSTVQKGGKDTLIAEFDIDSLDATITLNNDGCFPNGYTLSFDPVQAQDKIFFGCEDSGRRGLSIYFISDGTRIGSCTVYGEAQSTAGDGCGATANATISGIITTSKYAPVSNVSVALLGADINSEVTNVDGVYAFPTMNSGGEYLVKPTKDDDILNGVNTLDIVRIQRHLLEIKEITNPYDLIAADVNNDNAIRATDLLALRNAILGSVKTFPNNTSWRFIESGYEFRNELAAQKEAVKEDYEINSLEGDMSINFVAVKVGDIDGSAATQRSEKSFDLIVKDEKLEGGNTYEIAVKAGSDATIFGLQSMLNTYDLDLVDVYAGAIDVQSTDFMVVENGIKMALAVAEGVTVKTGETLFTLNVVARNSALASSKINLGDELIAEAYISDELVPHNISLRWNGDVEGLRILSNNPNPWTTATNINVKVPNDGNVQIIVTDAQGRLVHTRSEYVKAGNRTFALTREQINVSGVLFYEVQQGDDVARGKLIRIE